MAKTYFKAQPVAAETQINWAEVGKNFSDMLGEEARVREEKKDAINDATRQFQNTLNDVEQGQSATANQWWLQAASDIQEQMLMQERLLKSGALKPKEYTMMRQNLTDGTDGLINVFNKYNKEFSERMERTKDEGNQYLEEWTMAELENFGNFQETAVVTNPETGMMSVAMVDGNGQIINDPNKIRSITSLQALIAQRYDRYDLEGATTAWADSVGVWEDVERKYGSRAAKGMMTVVSDPMDKTLGLSELQRLGLTREEAIVAQAELGIYAADEQNFVDDIMSVWSNTSSILTNTKRTAPNGEVYDFTFSEDRKENEILLKKDGQGIIYAEYTPKQKKEVSKAIKNSIRNKLNRKIKQPSVVSDYVAPTRAETQASGEADAQKNILLNVRQLFSGKTPASVKESENTLRSINNSIKEIDRTNTGITITYTDRPPEEIPFEALNEKQWVTGAVNFFLPEKNKILNINKALEAAGFTGDGSLKTELAGTITSAAIEQQSENINETVRRELGSEVRSSIVSADNVFIEDDEDATVTNLNSVLTAYLPEGTDFKVEDAGGGGYDRVTVKIDGVQVGNFKLDESRGFDESRAAEFRDKLERLIVDAYIKKSSAEDKMLRFRDKRRTTTNASPTEEVVETGEVVETEQIQEGGVDYSSK